MKKVLIVLAATVLAGCGTLGGAVNGVGEDLSKVGTWIKNR